MSLLYDKNLKHQARSLRTTTTDAERKLWSAVRRKQIKGRLFSRQKTIGRYIVDFYCASASLVVEIDGGQHYTGEGRDKDRQRDQALAAMGLKVLRFSDRDVLTNVQGVLEVIWVACGEVRNPLSPPLPKGDNAGVTPGESLSPQGSRAS
jgi:very-short-patch-repair endonuclease